MTLSPAVQGWLTRQVRPRPRPTVTRARNAAREKALAAYVLLECGHYTGSDTIEFYSAWSPGKGWYYCEQHHEWVHKQPKPKRPVYPVRPPY